MELVKMNVVWTIDSIVQPNVILFMVNEVCGHNEIQWWRSSILIREIGERESGTVEVWS